MQLYFPLGTTVDAVGRETTVPIRPKPSDAHKLLALLEEKKMLLRVYSQNIDGTFYRYITTFCVRIHTYIVSNSIDFL